MYHIYRVDKGREIMEIGTKLKAYRLFFNLTQEELAYKAGLNEKYYGRLERNESCPTIEKLQQICNALNIDIASFFLNDVSNDKCSFNQTITNIVIDGLKHNIDIHFNRDKIIEGVIAASGTMDLSVLLVSMNLNCNYLQLEIFVGNCIRILLRY